MGLGPNGFGFPQHTHTSGKLVASEERRATNNNKFQISELLFSIEFWRHFVI